MQRSKQLALMFLLGAALVGGALGFSADRLMARRACSEWSDPRAARRAFYDDLSLTTAQRASFDTILDAKHRQIGELARPLRPQLDAISDTARAQMMRVLTPAQRTVFEERRREIKAREQAHER